MMKQPCIVGEDCGKRPAAFGSRRNSQGEPTSAVCAGSLRSPKKIERPLRFT